MTYDDKDPDAIDDRIEGEIFDKMCSFLKDFFIALVVLLFFGFLLISGNKEFAKFATIENLIILGLAFIFAFGAFWASHNKDRPEIMEFREPKFPKE